MSEAMQTVNKTSLLVRVFKSPCFTNGCEIGIGILLLVAVLIHLSGPFFFLESAARYQILDATSLAYLLPFLVSLQFVLAICLLVRFAPRLSLLLVGLMFAVFMLCQLSVLLRGLTADCGCFGSASDAIGAFSILKLLALVILCFSLAWVHPTDRDLETQTSIQDTP